MAAASDSTETQIESYDTQETLQVNKKEFSNRAGSDCTIKEFKLSVTRKADISCFCYSSPYIYYGISYTFYKESMLISRKRICVFGRLCNTNKKVRCADKKRYTFVSI